jgi:hypothetical protein
MAGSPNETLRTTKKKLVRLGASKASKTSNTKKAKKSPASPNSLTSAQVREGLAKLQEKVGKLGANRDRSALAGLRADFEDELERALTKNEKAAIEEKYRLLKLTKVPAQANEANEMGNEETKRQFEARVKAEKLVRNIENSEIDMAQRGRAAAMYEALLQKLKYNPLKKKLGRSPTSADIAALKAFAGSEERRGITKNVKAAEKANADFLLMLKGAEKKGASEVDAKALEKALTAARDTRRKQAKLFEDQLEDAIDALKPKVEAEMTLARGGKKNAPAAKDINALARIRAQGVKMTGAEYVAVQRDVNGEVESKIIDRVIEAAQEMGPCALCDTIRMFRSI